MGSFRSWETASAGTEPLSDIVNIVKRCSRRKLSMEDFERGVFFSASTLEEMCYSIADMCDGQAARAASLETYVQHFARQFLNIDKKKKKEKKKVKNESRKVEVKKFERKKLEKFERKKDERKKDKKEKFE